MVNERQRMLQNSRCGAVLADTKILLANGEEKGIEKITKSDYLLTAHESRMKVDSIFCRRENAFYSVQAGNGKRIQATAQQCLLTKLGWKRVRNLTHEDEVMCFDLQMGRAYYPVLSIEKQMMDDEWGYAVGIGDKTFIANGFICSDYDMQHEDDEDTKEKGKCILTNVMK